jgi:assimilatory nitrate reductase catalytic subunit
MHVAIKDRLVDERFVAERTSGFRAVAQRAGAYWPDRVERITGVPVEALARTAHLLAEGPRTIILTARGPEQQSQGTDAVSAFINLALALGKAGRPGCGYGCLTGQGNGQGGREHGQKADQLPGYRRIDDPAAREHVAAVWGVDADELPGPGRSAYELLDALGTDGGVRALLVMGSNPLVSAPHASHVETRVAALDFLAVCDPFVSETAERADVVLPVTQWAEEEGTMTNLEGRVILRRAAVEAPPGVRSDLEVLAGLAARLGCPGVLSTDPEAVFDELRRASAGGPADYAGISYERIARDGGAFWPCADEAGPDTPRLFLDRFATEDGRARFQPVNYRPPAEPPDDEYPLWFTTGRVLRQYQSGTQTRRVAALRTDPFVELHPVLARRHAIAEDDLVAVSSRRGEAIARARLTPDIRPDTVFMPFHWPGRGRANLLTNPVLDPRSRMPEFKLCAVRIAPARPDLEEEISR